jgi:hypothetical protein
MGTEKRKPRRFRASRGFLKKRTISEAIKDIPPFACSRSPIMLPHVMIMAKLEKTLPRPSVTASTVARGSPARIPVRIDTKIRLRKGCNLSIVVKKRIHKRAKKKIKTGCISYKMYLCLLKYYY